MAEKYVYRVRFTENPWYIRFLKPWKYKVTREIDSESYPDVDGWTAFYKRYDTEKEAKEEIPRLWAVHSNPLIVYVSGILFDKRFIQYRQEWADQNKISFWSS